jgi:hypothetical protein
MGGLPALDTFSIFAHPSDHSSSIGLFMSLTHLYTPCTDHPCSKCSEKMPGSSFYHHLFKITYRTSILLFRKNGVYFMFYSWTFVTQAQFHIACIATPQQCTWTFDTYCKLLTNTQEVPTHSAAPSKCIHSSNPKSHKDETGTDRQDITEIQTSQAGTLQQPMFICGHTHTSPEPRPI